VTPAVLGLVCIYALGSVAVQLRPWCARPLIAACLAVKAHALLLVAAQPAFRCGNAAFSYYERSYLAHRALLLFALLVIASWVADRMLARVSTARAKRRGSRRRVRLGTDLG
jgi:hypothetical protein